MITSTGRSLALFGILFPMLFCYLIFREVRPVIQRKAAAQLAALEDAR